jgi:hypothetical protein
MHDLAHCCSATSLDLLRSSCGAEKRADMMLKMHVPVTPVDARETN